MEIKKIDLVNIYKSPYIASTSDSKLKYKENIEDYPSLFKDSIMASNEIYKSALDTHEIYRGGTRVDSLVNDDLYNHLQITNPKMLRIRKDNLDSALEDIYNLYIPSKPYYIADRTHRETEILEGKYILNSRNMVSIFNYRYTKAVTKILNKSKQWRVVCLGIEGFLLVIVVLMLLFSVILFIRNRK